MVEEVRGDDVEGGTAAGDAIVGHGRGERGLAGAGRANDEEPGLGGFLPRDRARRRGGLGEGERAVPVQPVEGDPGEGPQVAVAVQALGPLDRGFGAGAATGDSAAETGIAGGERAPHEARVVAERALGRRRRLSGG